ncbi:creatininase family protein [Engelhardtia mirabilis]|uniref:Creatinine amidohydrolase n=1 Tax=Engelhardtia mirabilis TaxID=2528011 RepID=A0A518BHN6_9BACT|nr:Creatinine amidohydrolase [Planctomycetes bacterium Pla133]QDV00815.1 Creatinine amidohydrolase [Planctomycetes bacterium Pla86]
MTGNDELRLTRRTWPEARALFGPDLVAIVPVGSTEPHGPHLPLDVDVTIADAQAMRAAELLVEQGVSAIVLPPVNYGVTFFTDGFEGRVTLRPGTLWAVLEDLVDSLSEQGVRRVVLCNAHLEPGHIKVLRGIAKDYAEPRAEKAVVVFPDNTRRRWAGTLGAEFQSGDCHAGQYETSIVLAADPGGVRAEAQKSLPSVQVDLVEKMQAGAQSFREVGAVDAYCGDPAAATAAEGRELIDALAEMVCVTVRERWPDLFERAAESNR